MEMFTTAIGNVFNPMCLFLIWGGTMLGIIFGSIPGLSATMAVVLFLPLTFGMEPTMGLALLVGLYMGGISGGLISAILLKIPGTPSSISTVFDGGPMAERGEAGRALGVGILASGIGSLIGIVALIFISPLLAKVCLLFGATEYFAVAVFSLTIIAALSGKDMLKGLLAGLFGLALSMVGMAPVDAMSRFTFGNYQLLSGFDITVLLIGVFAVTDIVQAGIGRKHLADGFEKKTYHLKGYGLSVKEFITQIPNFIISSVIGIVIGILPGIGGSTGGLLVHGISPGPLIFQNSGEYVYGIYLALIVSTVFMVIFERLGLPIFTKLLDIPKHILLPIIMVMCCVGAFSSDSRAFDVMCVLAFAMVGLLFKVFKLPSTPLIIGFILGPMFEENLRRALMASHGDWTTFVTHPISCVFLAVAVVFCTITVRKNLKEKKAAEAKGEVFDTAEEEG